MKVRTPLAALALGGALLASPILASSAQADPFKPGKLEQVKLGQQAAAEIRRKERVLPDSDPRVQLLRRIGNRYLQTMNLNPKSDPWQFSFDVIDSKEINAFALPGGPVFFYTGILDRMKTEDEVAGVLGHEMTHVTREHWAYATRDAQKRNIGITLFSLFGGGRTVATVADVLGSINDLKFSRQHESQADEGGFTLMSKAGFNPEGEVDVFKMLGKLGGSGGPEFLATHPDPGNRVKRLQGMVDKSKRQFPPLTPLPFSTPAMRGELDPKKKDGKGGLSLFDVFRMGF